MRTGPMTTILGSALAAVVFLTVGCTSTTGAAPKAPSTAAPAPTAAIAPGVRAVALPGAPAEGVPMDIIAYEPAHHRVWVPAGNTGSVDLVDTNDGSVTRMQGFPTSEMERRGRRIAVGPSAVAIGDDFAYIGDRGDSSIHPVDLDTLELGTAAKLDGMPDLLAFASVTHEVWVTTPHEQAIVILDAAAQLTRKGTITFEGEPEGLVVDEQRGVVYTNLEDRDLTLAVDLRSHQITHSWAAHAGEGGPKCLALDHAHGFLLVACPDHVDVIDPARDGKLLSSIATGSGVDDIDYVEARHELYAAARSAGTLTVARMDAHGVLTRLRVVPTAVGARNAVATERGVAYLTDAPRGSILVVPPPAGE